MERAQAQNLIANERNRQLASEGFDATHDDAWIKGELVAAATAYLHSASTGDPKMPSYWPWDEQWWKPKDKLSNAVRAGALLLAEKERKVRANDTDFNDVNAKFENVLKLMESIDG